MKISLKIQDPYDSSHVDITYWIHYYRLYKKNLSQIISDFEKTESGKLSIIGTVPDKVFIKRQNNGYATEPEHKFYTSRHIKKIQEEVKLINHLVQELTIYDSNKTQQAKTVA